MNDIEKCSGLAVIRAAMEVEKSGHRFYADLQDKSDDPSLAELFAELAREELQHLERLMAVAERFHGESVAVAGDFLPYLKGFEPDAIFPGNERLEEALAQPDATLKVLDLAIEAEETFAAFLRQAEVSAQTEDGRQALAWLAAEETRHAAAIRARREALSIKN